MDIPRIPIPAHLFNSQQLYNVVMQYMASKEPKSSLCIRKSPLLLYVSQYAPNIVVSDKFYTALARLTEEAFTGFKKGHPDIEIKELVHSFIEVKSFELIAENDLFYLLIKSFDILSFEPLISFGTPEELNKCPGVKRCCALYRRVLCAQNIPANEKSIELINCAIQKGIAPSIVIKMKAPLEVLNLGLTINQIEEMEKKSLEVIVPMEDEHEEKKENINLGEFIENLANQKKSAESQSLTQSGLKKSLKVQSQAKETSNDIQMAIAELISTNPSEGRSKKVLDHLAGVSANDVTKEKKKLGKSIKILKEGDAVEEENFMLTREQLKRFKEWKDLKEYDSGMNRKVSDLLNDAGKMDFRFEEEPEQKKKKTDN